MTKLIAIGETRRLGTREPKSVSDLNMSFITEVRALEPPPRGQLVDSFRLLHSLLRQIHLLGASNEIFFEIGDELKMTGAIKDGTCWPIIDWAGGISVTEMPIANFQWELVSLVHELSESVRNTGLDVDEVINRFPAYLGPPKTWRDYFGSEPPPGLR